MSRSGSPRTFVLVGLAILVIVNVVVFRGFLTSWVADVSGTWLSPVANRVMQLRSLAVSVLHRVDLAAQNAELQNTVVQMQSQQAQRDDAQDRLQLCRSVAGIRDRIGIEPIEAGIFSYPQSGGVRKAVANRGSDDWVSSGDVVVTASGALVGVVDQVFSNHSSVRLVGDVGLEVTAHILGTDISGLLRVDTGGNVLLDLVQKNESVSEGQTVVTSGDDQYSAGLVIGTIYAVDNNASTLFQIVRVAPIVAHGVSGRVLIFRP